MPIVAHHPSLRQRCGGKNGVFPSSPLTGTAGGDTIKRNQWVRPGSGLIEYEGSRGSTPVAFANFVPDEGPRAMRFDGNAEDFAGRPAVLSVNMFDADLFSVLIR